MVRGVGLWRELEVEHDVRTGPPIPAKLSVGRYLWLGFHGSFSVTNSREVHIREVHVPSTRNFPRHCRRSSADDDPRRVIGRFVSALAARRTV
jgi:hypothetical protein